MTLHRDTDTLAKSPAGMRPLVLVVDDNGPIRQLVSRVLATRDFDVHVAGSAPDAMRLASILRFDAAVVDLGMPDEASGLDLLEWFRAHRSYGTLPLLILTGHLNLSESVQAVIRQLHGYVFYKGHSLVALVEQLTRLLPRHVLSLTPFGTLPSAA